MNTTSENSRSRPRKSATACLASLLLAGCGASVPTHYYTLLGDTNESARAGSPRFLIDLQPVVIPAQADQPKLVVRTGDGSMILLEHERWVAPLSDELHAALSVNLTNELHTADVSGLTAASALPVVRIKVDIRRFESELGRFAVIDSTWSLSLKDARRQTLVCSSQARTSVGNDYASLPLSYRSALATLSSQIAMTVEQYERDPATSCPPLLSVRRGVSGSS